MESGSLCKYSEENKNSKRTSLEGEEASANSSNLEEIVNLKKELNSLYDKEEKMWRQRSRIQSLKGGDQNTKNFHGSVTHRKRRNFIKGLRDGNGLC